MRSLKDAMGPALGRLAEQAGTAAPLTPLWTAAVGEVIARHTRPRRLAQGVLTIACDAPAWKEALEPERAATLKKLQAQLGESLVRSLVFESP